MSAVWLSIAITAVVTIAIKAAGPLALGRRELGARASAVLALLPSVLLCALIVATTFGEDGRLVVGPRAAGVAAAGLALAARAPVLLVVGVAAGVTAAVRALG